MQIGRGQVDPSQIAQLSLGKDDNAVRLVLVDGRFSTELSSIGQLPDGVFIGSLENAPYKAAQCLVRPFLGTAHPLQLADQFY